MRVYVILKVYRNEIGIYQGCSEKYFKKRNCESPKKAEKKAEPKKANDEMAHNEICISNLLHKKGVVLL